MTTTSPSWFPSWPSDFPDVEDAYIRTVPRQWPAGLYDEGTDERRDLDGVAVALSWIAQGGEWIKRRLFPQFDSGAMFLHYWEDALGIARAATVSARQAAIIAYCRLMLGTATKATIQKIMAPIFGLDDYNDIDFSFATFADVEAFAHTQESGRAYVLSRIHIHSNGTAAPDITRALDAIEKFKPTWVHISVGQYETLKWGTGKWGQACWGRVP